MRHRDVVGPIVASLVYAHSAGAQGSVVRVPEAVHCGRCRIAIDTVVRLGDRDGPGALAGEPAAVRRDARGRYWVMGHGIGLVVFGPQGGRPLWFAPRGPGPGEFEGPGDAVPIAGDSIVVIDASRRAVVVSPDLRPARTIPYPQGLAPVIALQWPDVTVTTGWVLMTEGGGWPLHHLSFATSPATVVASFGVAREAARPDRMSHMMRHLAIAPDGFWAAEYVRYRLHQWDRVRRHQRTLERDAPWFSTPSMLWIGNKTTPPPPLVAGVGTDSAGVVWVAVHRARSTWQEAWANFPDDPREMPSATIEVERLYDVVLEAIDPAIGRVVARSVFPGYVVSVLPDRQMVLYDTDDDGIPRLMVVRFRVVQ